MDDTVLYLINYRLATPLMDMPMAALSSWSVWWPIALACALAILFLGGVRARSMVLTAAVTLAINDGLVCRTLKETVGRPRPGDKVSGVRMIDLGKASPRLLALALPLKVNVSSKENKSARGKSFPSSHAANCFALAMVVFAFYRKAGWLAFLPAFIVAYSRLYVGAHWPSDVLAGCLVGMLCGMASASLFRILWVKLAPKFFPLIYESHPDLP